MSTTLRKYARSLAGRVRDGVRVPYDKMSGRAAACDAALTLQRRHDFPAAFDAWEVLLRRWPRDILVLRSLAACAREVDRLDYSCELVERALRLRPHEPTVLAEAALNEERRGRWAAAAASWKRIVFGRRAYLLWRQSYVHVLLVLGRFDEAEALAAAWARDHPDHAGFLALRAMIAASRGNLDEALSLWVAYRARFPDDPVGWEHYGRTYQAKQNATLDGADAPAIDPVAPEAIELAADADVAALLMRFESLGHNCEFGLVQRRFGAEPLGLLRFNAVTFGDLVTAAANGFVGMGDPELTELAVIPNGEYFVQDRRWGLGMHTFIFEGQAEPAALFIKLCRRVAYLRDRFLEDLAAGRKILVFTYPKLSRDALEMLHRALRSLGPVTLLYVAFGSEVGDGFSAEPAGVVAIAPGLYIGRLSREGQRPSGSWDIAFGEWVDLCGLVLAAAAASDIG